MVIKVLNDSNALAKTAAAHAADALRFILKTRPKARLVAATGASQLAFLRELTAAQGIDWNRVELFHLDEYIGVPQEHPASFCRYLRQNLIEATGITNHHLMNGTDDPARTIREVSHAISSAPVDLAFVGIGENGHLAFNDPPADFESEEPYLIVNLDEACRRQQVGEGWFATISQVPERAISMSIRQILAAHEIICVVPDARKAQAVHACFDEKISPMAPASILRTHANTTVYLDKDSAAQLSAATLSQLAASA
jgi:glucosamine-6-phosphate deaminase